jgi:hypothetical protein
MRVIRSDLTEQRHTAAHAKAQKRRAQEASASTELGNCAMFSSAMPVVGSRA